MNSKSFLGSPFRCEAGVALMLLLLTGCNRNDPPVAVAPAPAPAAAPVAAASGVPAQPAAGEYYVEGDLPPPQPEVMIERPGPDHIWIAGYWGYRDGGRVWERGHWERQPHAHAEWVPAHWERRGRGHVFIRGFWR